MAHIHSRTSVALTSREARAGKLGDEDLRHKSRERELLLRVEELSSDIRAAKGSHETELSRLERSWAGKCRQTVEPSGGVLAPLNCGLLTPFVPCALPFHR